MSLVYVVCTYVSTYSMESKIHINVPWIIDTNALDHIISTPTQYLSITENLFSGFVLPNGDKIDVFHVVTVKISDELILHNVLFVPCFNYNIISAKRLTQD